MVFIEENEQESDLLQKIKHSCFQRILISTKV